MNEKYKTMYKQVVELLGSHAVDEYAKDTICASCDDQINCFSCLVAELSI